MEAQAAAGIVLLVVIERVVIGHAPLESVRSVPRAKSA
jgi:hypothetical protein